MLDRVFAAADVECSCSLRREGHEPETTQIVRISRTKAVIDVMTPFAEGVELDFDLTIAPGAPLTLRGRVVHSGEMGLFVEWLHADEKAASRLQTRLVESASLEPRRRATDEPPAGTSAKPTPKATTKAPAEAQAASRSATTGQTAAARQAAKRVPAKETEQLAPTEPAAQPAPPIAAPSTPEDAPRRSPRTVAESAKDVGERLLRHSRTMRSSDLAAARENVQVLDMATLTGLIQGAVDEAVATLASALGDAERKALLQEAEENFKARLAIFQAEKQGVESKAKHLQAQLDKAQQLLEEERLRLVSADQFTVSNAGMAELDERLSRILDRALRSNTISGDIESEMRGVVARLLDDERDKITAKAREAQSDALDLLERKVGRLAKALEETQKAREKAERRANALESAGTGIRPLMQAGLDDDDPDREQKLVLLKDLLESNRKVREQMAAEGIVIQAARPRGPVAPVTTEAANDGVKKISVPVHFTPPPLQRTRQKQPEGDDGSASDEAEPNANEAIEELS